MLKGKIIFENTFNTPRRTPIETSRFIFFVMILYSFCNLVASEKRYIERTTATIGCKILNLVSISLLESKSSDNPTINDSLGNIRSAKAAIEPVAPESKNKNNH